MHSFAMLEPDYNECFWQATCGLLSVLLPGLYNCDPGVAMPLGAHRFISSYIHLRYAALLLSDNS